jgi:hypothetical protein
MGYVLTFRHRRARGLLKFGKAALPAAAYGFASRAHFAAASRHTLDAIVTFSATIHSNFIA